MTTTTSQTTTLLPAPTPLGPPTTTSVRVSTINGTTSAVQQQRRHLLHSVESLRGRVRQVLKCVINLHIEFLVIEQKKRA